MNKEKEEVMEREVWADVQRTEREARRRHQGIRREMEGRGKKGRKSMRARKDGRPAKEKKGQRGERRRRHTSSKSLYFPQKGLSWGEKQ